MPAGAGHYASFHLKVCAPEGGRGLWLRFTVLKPPGGATYELGMRERDHGPVAALPGRRTRRRAVDATVLLVITRHRAAEGTAMREAMPPSTPTHAAGRSVVVAIVERRDGWEVRVDAGADSVIALRSRLSPPRRPS